MRQCVCVVVMLIACGSSDPKATTPGANGSTRHRATVRITKCTPVGYGFECESDLDGNPTTLEACVGSGDHIGLTPRLRPPLTLAVDVESALDTDRYCGIIITATGKHVRIVAIDPAN